MSFDSMPRQDLLLAIDGLAQEKQIERDIVFESLEAAITKIAKQKYGEEWNIVSKDVYKRQPFGLIDNCFKILFP